MGQRIKSPSFQSYDFGLSSYSIGTRPLVDIMLLTLLVSACIRNPERPITSVAGAIGSAYVIGLTGASARQCININAEWRWRGDSGAFEVGHKHEPRWTVWHILSLNSCKRTAVCTKGSHANCRDEGTHGSQNASTWVRGAHIPGSGRCVC